MHKHDETIYAFWWLMPCTLPRSQVDTYFLRHRIAQGLLEALDGKRQTEIAFT